MITPDDSDSLFLAETGCEGEDCDTTSVSNSGGKSASQGGNGHFWDMFNLGFGSGGDNSRVVIDHNDEVSANAVAQANVQAADNRALQLELQHMTDKARHDHHRVLELESGEEASQDALRALKKKCAREIKGRDEELSVKDAAITGLKSQLAAEKAELYATA